MDNHNSKLYLQYCDKCYIIWQLIKDTIRAQTNTRLFSEYLNIRLFDYDFEYSNNRFKGNM